MDFTQTTTDPTVSRTAEDKHRDMLDAALVREREFETTWWKRAEMAYNIYAFDKKDRPEEEVPYNILYSNTEVLLPSLYSATPKPDIRSRFKGQEIKPLPDILERFLTIASDPANPGGDCFDFAMQDCVLSSLVPGMGYVRIRYIKDRSFPLTYESGHYKTLLWGKASKWSKVPWVAFRHPMKKDQMLSQFEKSSEDALENFCPSGDSDDEKDDCCVYEFWDKKTKKVYFLSEQWNEVLLKESDDPLGMENFFPTPGPLLLTLKPGKLQPIPLYDYYRNQAEELNRVSVRLNRVLSAIRVRGAYNGLLGDDLKKLLSSDAMDNDLVAASEAGLLAQSGGFDKHIWLLPIERFIVVAQELYRAREAIKQVIYELTGISDIIRGSSVASETATAQDLKNKWGTVRLRKMQKSVADYARDLFRMSVDCGAQEIPAEEWKRITQLPIPTHAEKQAAIARIQQTQQMAIQTGQPPSPPDPQLIQSAQSPSFEELLDKIKSDQNRTYVVNIQTSSTIDLDTAQDKGEVDQFMNAMGQLMAGLAPLVQLGPTGMEAAKAILIAVCQRYKFGLDIVDSLKNLTAPPPPPPEQKGPPPPSPEEQQALKAETDFKMAQVAAKQQILQAQTQLDLAKIEAEKAKLSIDIELANLRLQQQSTKVPAGKPNAPVRN